MRRVDVFVIGALVIIAAVATWLLILTAGPVAVPFAFGFALLFGIFLIASLLSGRYGRQTSSSSQEGA